ncbi:MAG: hypothetical protein Q9157_003385 [Trypethelium eluteriae]
MKRKLEACQNESINGATKKRALPLKNIVDHFRDGLFDETQLLQYRKAYLSSEPYKHGVIPSLINQTLLRSVRHEIRTNLSFTPKETDIYRLHQSGDLANLSGLDSSSLARLPSLLKLRDALYSSDFRSWIAQVADSGPLSGQKTDMAINVYTPGDHLLCHDDVIGTRRVSYILYLTDPDKPWRPEWGGALRLYPLEKRYRHSSDIQGDVKEEEVKTPSPEWTKSIPPEFNQLSFFAVQPGESFHDVEEVYHRSEGAEQDDGGRVRMAISGWYHIPQRGEDGYEEGLERRVAAKSSLAQLQGNVDEFDEPQVVRHQYPATVPNATTELHPKLDTEDELSEADLDFLLQFMDPKYLTPDTVEQLQELFADESSLRLADFLSKSYAQTLHAYILAAELDLRNPNAEAQTEFSRWRLARPPHKHRFQYYQGEITSNLDSSPEDKNYILRLLNQFFASVAFRKWLSLSTGLKLGGSNLTARRFRRGMDYTLATAYENDEPQLEFTFGMTPTKGWEAPEDEDDIDGIEEGAENDVVDGDRSSEDEIPAESLRAKTKGQSKGSSGSSALEKARPEAGLDKNGGPSEHIDVGGHEVYMAAEDPSSTADPAQYKSSAPTGEDEDDSILFSTPPNFNHLSVVLRDKGVLRFVKYVSQKAKGDRWDIIGDFAVEDFDQEGDGEEAEADGED